MADRYMYLPQIGLSIAVTWAALYVVRSWPHRAWLCGAAAAPVIVALMACASQQTTYWRDSEALWKRDIACTSRNNRAHSNLAGELLRRGDFGDAIKHFEAAMRIEPEDASSYRGLGDALIGLGKRDKSRKRFEEAVVQYEEALRIEPGHAGAHSNLGNALARLGRFDEAIAQYEAALSIEPNHAEAYRNLKIVQAIRKKAKP